MNQNQIKLSGQTAEAAKGPLGKDLTYDETNDEPRRVLEVQS